MDPEDHDLVVNLEGLPLYDENGEVYCILTVIIDNSIVHVILEEPIVPEGADPRQVRTAASRDSQFWADMILAAINFEEGGTFTVRISRIFDESFTGRHLGPRPNFGHEAETLKIENHIGIGKDVLLLSFGNKWFARAMLDYSTAMRWSHDAPFYCYRALEALSRHYDEKKSKAWTKMHKSLGTNRCAIYTLIQQHADPIRHAEDPDYVELERLPYYALTYVRDTLLAFLIKNSETDIDRELPVLDHSRIPDHIVAKHTEDCPLSTPHGAGS